MNRRGYRIVGNLCCVVMAKHPVPGRVKTRLTPEFSPDAAARVQEAFVRHWGERLAELDLPLKAVFFDPPEAAAAFAELLPVALRAVCRPQVSGDLGARLVGATASLGHRRSIGVFFLGVDSPDVPRDMLLGAMALVRRESVVIGPASDGGFWCLGLGPSVRAEAVLEGIAWSSGREQAQVVAAARRAGYDARLAGMWDDVDRPDDLRRLVRRLKISRDPMDRRLLRRLQSLPSETLA